MFFYSLRRRRYQQIHWLLKKNHFDSTKEFSETDIIKIREFFVYNIFVIFGGCIFFQQTVGIPIGTNCASLLADLFLYSYKADFIKRLLKKIENRKEVVPII